MQIVFALLKIFRLRDTIVPYLEPDGTLLYTTNGLCSSRTSTLPDWPIKMSVRRQGETDARPRLPCYYENERLRSLSSFHLLLLVAHKSREAVTAEDYRIVLQLPRFSGDKHASDVVSTQDEEGVSAGGTDRK